MLALEGWQDVIWYFLNCTAIHSCCFWFRVLHWQQTVTFHRICPLSTVVLLVYFCGWQVVGNIVQTNNPRSVSAAQGLLLDLFFFFPPHKVGGYDWLKKRKITFLQVDAWTGVVINNSFWGFFTYKGSHFYTAWGCFFTPAKQYLYVHLHSLLGFIVYATILCICCLQICVWVWRLTYIKGKLMTQMIGKLFLCF